MDRVRIRRLWFCGIVIILNLAFIWGNSLMPGHISAAISGFVRRLLSGIFSGEIPEGVPAGEGILRKIAHLLEFCSLGFFCSVFLRLLRKKYLFSLLIGFLVGTIDECIQLFVPERGPHIRDVLIDTLGVIAGIGVFTIALLIRRRKLILEDNTQ